MLWVGGPAFENFGTYISPGKQAPGERCEYRFTAVAAACGSKGLESRTQSPTEQMQRAWGRDTRTKRSGRAIKPQSGRAWK